MQGTRPTNRDSYLIGELAKKVVQTDHGGSIEVNAAQWKDGDCIRGGTYGGSDQIAAAAVVLETDIVVVKREVLNRILENKDLQISLHLAMRYTAKRRQPQSMEALLALAKLTRRRPIFIMHAGPNGGGHFDCWRHAVNSPAPPFVQNSLLNWSSNNAGLAGEDCATYKAS